MKRNSDPHPHREDAGRPLRNLGEEFAGGEEEGDFIGGGFWGIGAVGGVLLDVEAEVFADRAGGGFFGIGGAHQLTPFGDRALALQHRVYNWARGHVVAGAAEEWR